MVDYVDGSQLSYALTGIDTVISTVLGDAQVSLIDAAVQAGVRRFVPAEFNGPPHLRPVVDPLGRGQEAALTRLRYYENQLEFTVFVCGVFYERFAPRGMGALSLGLGSGISREGDYIMDVRNARAQIPHQNLSGQIAQIGMTSAIDVARFVVRALDFAQWPPELWMQGDRMSAWDIVQKAELIRGIHPLSRFFGVVNRPHILLAGRSFERLLHTPMTLPHALNVAIASEDWDQAVRTQHLIATCENRYDFENPILNSMVDFVPTNFTDWLRHAWEGQ